MKATEKQLLQAQETALRAERRYWDFIEQEKKNARLLLVDVDLLTLDGMGRQIVHLLERAMDRIVKPVLKSNRITYRAGLAVRDLYRKSRGSKGEES